jgi:hypothetical protein
MGGIVPNSAITGRTTADGAFIHPIGGKAAGGGKVRADGLCNERGSKCPEIGTGSDRLLDFVARVLDVSVSDLLIQIDLRDLGLPYRQFIRLITLGN